MLNVWKTYSKRMETRQVYRRVDTWKRYGNTFWRRMEIRFEDVWKYSSEENVFKCSDDWFCSICWSIFWRDVNLPYIVLWPRQGAKWRCITAATGVELFLKRLVNIQMICTEMCSLINRDVFWHYSQDDTVWWWTNTTFLTLEPATAVILGATSFQMTYHYFF